MWMGKCRFALAVLSLLLVTGGTQAAPAISVRDAWIPEGPPIAAVLAGYLTLGNSSPETRRLVAVHSPDFAAIEIHQTLTEDGMSRMRRLEALTLYARDEVKLRPGGIHLMLIKPRRRLRDGDTVTLTFELDDGTRFPADVPVRATHGDEPAMRHEHH